MIGMEIEGYDVMLLGEEKMGVSFLFRKSPS